MTDICVRTTLLGVPVNALVDVPEISIQRSDTGAIVVASDPMVDRAALGLYTYAFVPVAGLNYCFIIDTDPSVTGQTDVRFFEGSFDREVFDLWRARGLDPAFPKATTENVADVDYDEDAGDLHMDQVKAGNVVTTTRV